MTTYPYQTYLNLAQKEAALVDDGHGATGRVPPPGSLTTATACRDHSGIRVMPGT